MVSVEIDLILLGFGLCIGSFLNVCIHRFLRGESIVSPGSYCPACRKPIAWYDNIPLLSFIILGGKCRKCGAPISPRYFFVELLTGLIFVGSVHYFGMTAQAAASIVMLTLLLGMSAADLEERIIPDEMSLSGILFGLMFAFAFPVLHIEQFPGSDFFPKIFGWDESNRWAGLFMSFFGGFIGGGIIYATGVFGELVFRKESMGGGDVKLMAMVGAFLGWQKIILVFFLAPLLALPIGLYVKFVKKEDYIPYGPFLSLSAVIVLFFGDLIFRFFFFNAY